MELRKHPLMSYRSLSSWPPGWVWVGGRKNDSPKGELGILTRVKLVDDQFVSRCFLWMEYDGSTYLGCLLVGDAGFCRHLCRVLEENCGRSVQDIGGLDFTDSVDS